MSTLLIPKPIRKPKAVPRPLPRRSRLQCGKPPARSKRVRIKTRRPVGTKRAEAKAAGYVDPLTWLAICDFYRDELGVVRCAYGCGSPAREQDHVVPITKGGAHVPANVVPICPLDNQIKGTQTWEPVKRHPWMEAA